MEQKAKEVHEHLSGGEELSLKYRCSVSADDIASALLEKMSAALSSEIEQGFCMHGPHREDISVAIKRKRDKSIFFSGADKDGDAFAQDCYTADSYGRF